MDQFHLYKCKSWIVYEMFADYTYSYKIGIISKAQFKLFWSQLNMKNSNVM